MSWNRPAQVPREQRIAERAARNAAEAQTCLPRRAAVVGGGTVGPAPKDDPVRSEAYRRLVASLPCIQCCVTGHSHAAHPNAGKGMGTKADDCLCFPLCADRPGVRGCHSQFDQGGLYSKDRRRELEPMWGAQTRAVIDGMGNWPKGLEKME